MIPGEIPAEYTQLPPVVVRVARPELTEERTLIEWGKGGAVRCCRSVRPPCKVFVDAIGCDSLIITKLDGTAKGGVMIAIAEELSVPVDFIGLGEGIEDLEPFDADNYAEALFNA